MVFSQAWLCREQVHIFFKLSPKFLFHFHWVYFIFNLTAFVSDLHASKMLKMVTLRLKLFPSLFILTVEVVVLSFLSCLVNNPGKLGLNWAPKTQGWICSQRKSAPQFVRSNGSAPAHIWAEGWSEKLVKARVYILKYIINRRLFITVYQCAGQCL